MAAQAAVVAGIAAMVHAAIGLLDVHDLKRTTPRLAAALFAVTQQRSRAAAALALSHYLQERQAAGLPGKPPLKPVPAPTLAVVTSNIEIAVSDLYGPVDEVTVEADLAAVEKSVTASVERMILDTARDTTIAASTADPKPVRWAREVEPGCCYWCAMLATRGAVYKSAFRAGEENSFHDNCRCQIVPVFGKYEPTAQVRQWAADYKSVTAGLSAKDAAIAWRQHFEGRLPAPEPALVTTF